MKERDPMEVPFILYLSKIIFSDPKIRTHGLSKDFPVLPLGVRGNLKYFIFLARVL